MMFSEARFAFLLAPFFAPRILPGMLGSPNGPPVFQPFHPPFETAWSRGLYQTFELIRKATSRLIFGSESSETFTSHFSFWN